MGEGHEAATIESVYAGRARTVAALVCALEAVALLGFAGFYLYELSLGEGDVARVVMSAVLMLAFAGALVALAVHWRRASDWVGTPTIVWNLLLLPVAWTMFQADRGLVGVLVGGVALVGILAAIAARPDSDDQPDSVEQQQ